MNSPNDKVSADVRGDWLCALERELSQRREKHLLRQLRQVESASGPTVTMDRREYLQFSTNNYLGLATDPEVIAAAREATEKFGTGAGASRLVSGSLALHHELETALAKFKGTEAALLFPSGFMANLAVLTTFAGEGDVVVSDKLNHASLLDAAKYSGAHHRTYPHLQYGRARQLLGRDRNDLGEKSAPNGRRFLVTDSVFSMDGDIADLLAACDAAEAARALVILDEAHGTGVLGKRGTGLAELQGVEDRITLTIGTLSKALGSVGGFVVGPKAAIDTLINTARAFIYTTALPPACSAAARAALGIVERDPARRQRVMALAYHLRRELTGMGFDCGNSATPIVPVIVGDAEAAMNASAFLKERGIFVPAIRPPTVAPGSARLRISLMTTHTDSQVEQLLETLRDLRSASAINS